MRWGNASAVGLKALGLLVRQVVILSVQLYAGRNCACEKAGRGGRRPSEGAELNLHELNTMRQLSVVAVDTHGQSQYSFVGFASAWSFRPTGRTVRCLFGHPCTCGILVFGAGSCVFPVNRGSQSLAWCRAPLWFVIVHLVFGVVPPCFSIRRPE